MTDYVFVFGSNLAGLHGAGAAKHATKVHGAVFGVGEGRTGNAYALPTKNMSIRTRSLHEVKDSIAAFLHYARKHPDELFQVTRVGCGLAGYTDDQIAPNFLHSPANCHFDKAWYPILGDAVRYWN